MKSNAQRALEVHGKYYTTKSCIFPCKNFFTGKILFSLYKIDLAELKLEKGMSIKFPNGKNDLMYFQIEIKPSENYWQGGRFTFTFKIPDSYPHEPPKVLCDQIVYHPNLDTKGNICLNVLREDWSPVQTVTSVIFGLLFLFIDPNASDPLNSEAAKDLMQSTSNFKSNVRKAMMGGIINGVRFTKVI